MPQASEELRQKMRDLFGSIDAIGPVEFLNNAGYRVESGYIWYKTGTTLHNMPQKEYDCVHFLVQEWDYGLT